MDTSPPIEFHGYNQFTRTKSPIKKVFWALMICAALFGAIWWTVDVIKQYKNQSLLTRIDNIPVQELDIPDVQLCTMNIFDVSELRRQNFSERFITHLFKYFTWRQLARDVGMKQVAYLTNNYTMIYADFFHHELRTNLAKFRTALGPSNDFLSFVFKYGLRCEHFLRDCFLGRPFNCCQFAEPVLDPHLGKCFVLRNLSRIGKQDSTSASDGLYLLLDPLYMDMDRTGNRSLNGTYLERWSVAVELAKPFEMSSFTKSYIPAGMTTYMSIRATHYLRSNASQTGCTNDCSSVTICPMYMRQYALAKLCKCTQITGFYSPDFFYLEDMDDSSNWQPPHVCSPSEFSDCLMEKRHNISEVFSGLVQKCTFPPCDEWTYDVSLASVDLDVVRLSQLRGDAALNVGYTKLFIYHNQLMNRLVSEQEMVPIQSVISAIGGNFGLFLGASLITCIQLIGRIAKFLFLGDSFLTKTDEKDNKTVKKHGKISMLTEQAPSILRKLSQKKASAEQQHQKEVDSNPYLISQTSSELNVKANMDKELTSFRITRNPTFKGLWRRRALTHPIPDFRKKHAQLR